MKSLFSITFFIVINLIVPTQSYSAERDAEKIFNDYCFACHGTGWEGAPVIGDSFVWDERIEKGLEVLVKNTIEGIDAMPSKGSCADCTDEELIATVKWMTELE